MRQQLLVHGKKQWSGGVYATPLPDGSRICILNSRHNPRRTKITLMEEVAHIYLKHTPTGLMRSTDGLRIRGYDKKQEQDAYGVGAAALLPWPAIFPAVNKGMTIAELAEQFEVSSELIDYRIKITGAYTLYKARQRSRT
jgi:Zn-dependent peptidase ImmA (M78 family)